MGKKIFVTRADDLGSSRAANFAIEAALNAGFIKNVSVMAPGPEVEHAAQLLARRKDVCFGMHMTLNAEWDKVKWKPVSKRGGNCGLTDENGRFLPDPAAFEVTKPPVEAVMEEVAAQYGKLRQLGFDIKYIDSHMFAEARIHGLDEAVQAFAREKSLVDHMYFYALPPRFNDLAAGKINIFKWLTTIPAGQYFIVTHPAFYGEEMLKTGNAGVSGEKVAKDRDKEARLYSSKAVCLALKLMGFQGVRYDGAAPLARRLTVDDVMTILRG